MAKQSVTVRVDRELAEGEALVSEADLRYWDQHSDDWNHRHTLLGCNELPAHQQPIEGPAEPQLAQNLFLSSGTTPATGFEWVRIVQSPSSSSPATVGCTVLK